MLLQLVPNEGDAWSFALDNLGNSRSHALTLKGKLDALPELPAAVLAIDPEALPPVVRAFIGPAFPDLMSPLGRGTGELHLALRSLSQSPEVTPEPFSLLYQKIQTQKIRTHGDYHLGQVLYTGKDFVIIDFESEPVRSLTERRLKQSALRDVAAMIRSFHYAARGSLLARAEKQSMDLDYPRQWADPWYFYVSGTFLQA